MAANKGAILGLGILGISAFAFMSMKQPTSGKLTAGGVPSYTSPDSDDEDDWDKPDCTKAWNSNGNRISNEWVGHGELYVNWNNAGRNCDLQGFAIKVYTDKRVYIAGESVKVLILKKYYESDWDNEWHSWKNQSKKYGEQMAFLLGITSTDGNSLWNFQKTTGTGKNRSDIESMQWDGDLKSDGWPWPHNDHENLGIVMKSITTSNDDVGEYEVRFMGELGPYQAGSACGHSACNHTSGSDCNNRSTTSQKLITILPRDCSSPSSAESYESESKVDLNTEHFIQSYMQTWM